MNRNPLYMADTYRIDGLDRMRLGIELLLEMHLRCRTDPNEHRLGIVPGPLRNINMIDASYALDAPSIMPAGGFSSGFEMGDGLDMPDILTVER